MGDLLRALRLSTWHVTARLATTACPPRPARRRPPATNAATGSGTAAPAAVVPKPRGNDDAAAPRTATRSKHVTTSAPHPALTNPRRTPSTRGRCRTQASTTHVQHRRDDRRPGTDDVAVDVRVSSGDTRRRPMRASRPARHVVDARAMARVWSSCRGRRPARARHAMVRTTHGPGRAAPGTSCARTERNCEEAMPSPGDTDVPLVANPNSVLQRGPRGGGERGPIVALDAGQRSGPCSPRRSRSGPAPSIDAILIP